MSDLLERIEHRDRRRREQYAKLRALDLDLYRECIESSAAIAINRRLDLDAAADIEHALVVIALRAIEEHGR